jgi:hypothetical protein
MTATHRYDCDPAADLGTATPEHRPLHLIAADVLAATCGHCWAHPGEPCDAEGVHLARFARARRRGVISGPDMAAVLSIAAPDPEDVFTPATVIPAYALAGAAS